MQVHPDAEKMCEMAIRAGDANKPSAGATGAERKCTMNAREFNRKLIQEEHPEWSDHQVEARLNALQDENDQADEDAGDLDGMFGDDE